HVRRYLKLESRENLFGDRSAAEHMPAFADNYFLTSPRKIGCVNQAVVSASDDGDVVNVLHLSKHHKGFQMASHFFGAGVYSPSPRKGHFQVPVALHPETNG